MRPCAWLRTPAAALPSHDVRFVVVCDVVVVGVDVMARTRVSSARTSANSVRSIVGLGFPDDDTTTGGGVGCGGSGATALVGDAGACGLVAPMLPPNGFGVLGILRLVSRLRK